MEAHVAIGASRKFVLRSALLFYGDGSATFATLHPVVNRGEAGAPYLGPGQLLTTAFLKTLAEGLGTRLRAEVLPDNVLARTPDMITWWTQSGRELMFFGGAEHEARQLNGGTYPHPALVFKVTGRELFVRALERDERPGAETALKTAPYYNVDAAGRVCLGSMRVPDEVAVESLSSWRASFFQSEFTHASGAVRLTGHPGGFIGLWQSLKDSTDPFPIGYLTDAQETLRQFVER